MWAVSLRMVQHIAELDYGRKMNNTLMQKHATPNIEREVFKCDKKDINR